MRVQHSHCVSRPDFQPPLQLTSIPHIQRVQNQRRQREVVDPIDLFGDFDLLEVMTVDLDEYLDTKAVRLICQLRDEFEGFGNHEATGARLLNCISNGVEPNRTNAGGVKLLQDIFEVAFAFTVMDIDVDLLARKCGPQQTLPAVLELVIREW